MITVLLPKSPIIQSKFTDLKSIRIKISFASNHASNIPTENMERINGIYQWWTFSARFTFLSRELMCLEEDSPKIEMER